MSLPAISGAAIIAQRQKWERYSASLIPPLPTSSMSGSFQWPGPANGQSGSFMSTIRDADAPSYARLAVPMSRPDVAGGAPEIADLRRPQPRLGVAPFAEGEDDIAAARAQRVGHQRIGFLGIAGAGVAPIIFQIVDAPAGIGERVLIFVALAAGPAAAGLPAGVGIDAELQPLRVDIVGERLDAGREFLRVGGDEAVRRRAARASNRRSRHRHSRRRACPTRPSRRRRARTVASLTLQRELVPAVPAHRRRQREAVRRLAGARRTGRRGRLGQRRARRAGAPPGRRQG